MTKQRRVVRARLSLAGYPDRRVGYPSGRLGDRLAGDLQRHRHLRDLQRQATEDLSELLDGGLEPSIDPFPGGPEDVSLLRCFRTHVQHTSRSHLLRRDIHTEYFLMGRSS
ncbi:hypothetical protein Dimus_004969 [Dionaea muscipula]